MSALVGGTGASFWDVRRLWVELSPVDSAGNLLAVSEIWTFEAIDYSFEYGGLMECKGASILLAPTSSTAGFSSAGEPLLGRYSRIGRIWAETETGNRLVYTGILRDFGPSGRVATFVGVQDRHLDAPSSLFFGPSGTIALPAPVLGRRTYGPAVFVTGRALLRDDLTVAAGGQPDFCFGVAPDLFAVVGIPSGAGTVSANYALDARAQELTSVGAGETDYLSHWQVLDEKGLTSLGAGSRSDLPTLAPQRGKLEQASAAQQYRYESGLWEPTFTTFANSFDTTGGAGVTAPVDRIWTGAVTPGALAARLTVDLSGISRVGPGPVMCNLNVMGTQAQVNITSVSSLMFECPLEVLFTGGNVTFNPFIFIPDTSPSTRIFGSLTATALQVRKIQNSFSAPLTADPRFTRPLETPESFEFWLPGLHAPPLQVSGLPRVGTQRVAGAVCTFSAGKMRTNLKTAALSYGRNS